MNYELVRETIGTYLAGGSGWGSGGFAYVLQPENLPYTPPGPAWARWSLRPITADSADVGGLMRRTHAMLWFQLFVPEGKGTIDAAKMGDKIAAILDEKRLTVSDSTVILFRRANLVFIGPDGTGWQLWRCTVPFQIDTP